MPGGADPWSARVPWTRSSRIRSASSHHEQADEASAADRVPPSSRVFGVTSYLSDTTLALPCGALGPGLEQDRGAEEIKPAAKLIDQISLVRKVQRAAAVRENREGRRADGMLRDEKDAA